MDRPAGNGNRAPAASPGRLPSDQTIAAARAGWRSPSPVPITAWTVVLATSLLPTVVAQEILGADITLGQRSAVAVASVAAAYLATLAIVQLRVLRPLLVILLTLAGGQWLVFGVLGRVDQVQALTRDPAFAVYMPTEVVLNLLVTAAMLAVLVVLQRDRHSFFLARGDLAAPAEPIAWLGVRKGNRWTAVGRNLAIGISLGTLAFLVLSGTPTSELVAAALPVLPAILFAAALNAFNEEVTYKASILSVLEGPLGRRDALRMVAAYFGIAHFYGVPYGVIGVALAWFLGWILARSMAETRGMAWAWFIHFVQDVLIFAFLAGSAIVPGGG